MAYSGIIKDIKDIHSSLFDHKPVLRKEIEYFVKEFEDSRKDREVDKLFKILEIVTELKGAELEKTQALGDIHLPKLAAELQVAESIADKLNTKRSTADEAVLAKLDKKKAERVIEWDTFVHESTARCVKIDNNFAKKQEDVREAFRKTEEKIFSKKLEASSAEQ